MLQKFAASTYYDLNVVLIATEIIQVLKQNPSRFNLSVCVCARVFVCACARRYMTNVASMPRKPLSDRPFSSDRTLQHVVSVPYDLY